MIDDYSSVEGGLDNSPLISKGRLM